MERMISVECTITHLDGTVTVKTVEFGLVPKSKEFVGGDEIDGHQLYIDKCEATADGPNIIYKAKCSYKRPRKIL